MTRPARTPSRRTLLTAGASLGAFALTTTAAGCQSSPKPGDPGYPSIAEQFNLPVPKGHLDVTIGTPLGSDGFSPFTTSSLQNTAALWHVYEGLSIIDPTRWEPQPGLSQNLFEAGQISIDVFLRDGAIFHDGNPVTPDDVIYSFEAALDENNHYPNRELLDFFDHAAQLADNVVQLRLKYPTPDINSRLSLVKIIPEGTDPATLLANPNGTGPWKIKEHDIEGGTITFEAFDQYSGPCPALFETMTWHVERDESATIKSLTDGSTQVALPVPARKYRELEKSPQAKSNKLHLASHRSRASIYAMFNHAEGHPFAVAGARRGFMKAFDDKRCAEQVFGGYVDPVRSPLYPGTSDFDAVPSHYTHAPDEARDLFERANVNKVRLLASDENWTRGLAESLKGDLAALGLESELEVLPWCDVVKRMEEDADGWDAALVFLDAAFIGSHPETLLRSLYASPFWVESRLRLGESELLAEIRDVLERSTGPELVGDDLQRALQSLTNRISIEIPLYPLVWMHTLSAVNTSKVAGLSDTHALGFVASTATPPEEMEKKR
ncbi:ABC transporter substrate-binding protein [Dermabacter sp. p3-SID358]|uniref:ABC transporter substrate-binding protein n=1 Tax=Dermabacter sp. p3-SID358 TaxID=2916114 RepID=UPI0021A84CF1|nr:ABC transporter substrate-binding protein [Dermabacter sp. p3-SID358]MCT1867075.1 ABC transporter substrate-binding protein [Dermabacter sp. p3-SID358]